MQFVKRGLRDLVWNKRNVELQRQTLIWKKPLVNFATRQRQVIQQERMMALGHTGLWPNRA